MNELLDCQAMASVPGREAGARNDDSCGSKQGLRALPLAS